MKELFVTDLAQLDENHHFDGYFLVLVKQQRNTKSGKPYWNLVFGDKTGQIEARIWDVNNPSVERFDQGDIVKVRAVASRFEERLQLKVEQLRLCTLTDPVTKADLLPSTSRDVAELWAELMGFIDSFGNPHLQALLRAMLDDTAFGAAFREAPAAKQLHHAWLGGLLEHVVSLLNLAEKVAAHYPMLNRDLLMTGVILHDIGKTRELSWEMGFEYTVEGSLLGHIQIGTEMTERAIDRIPGFPARLKTLVLHMILAHHGKLEFGSPKLPMIAEALALSFVDDFDAKMMAIESEFKKCAAEGRKPDELTGKVWSLDQRQLLNTAAWLKGE